jgi:hypothetical protein
MCSSGPSVFVECLDRSIILLTGFQATVSKGAVWVLGEWWEPQPLRGQAGWISE